jgi:hypothetical protein
MIKCCKCENVYDFDARLRDISGKFSMWVKTLMSRGWVVSNDNVICPNCQSAPKRVIK